MRRLARAKQPDYYAGEMARSRTDLTVRAESIQRLYQLYLADRFRVNRRYQRKLVWSVAEKERLIDSIRRDLPIPLFLVAELETDPESPLEVIDGLQRLNAIFSFLENEFSLSGTYFDLDSLADTKLRKDRGELTQKEPRMPREAAADLANYQIALSVFRAPSEDGVDEVFRRINSGGRRLSRQELRQAGTISTLADTVRTVSAQIRGDSSPRDVVALRLMPNLSITNYSLGYGVNVDDIFWVKEGILRREEVRESQDEQLILDMAIDCLIEPLPNSGTRIRDEYYNYTTEDEATKASFSIESALRLYGPETFSGHFTRTYDEIRAVLEVADKRFPALIQAGSGGRSPRYFHAVFLAFFELLYKERLVVKDYKLAARALVNAGPNMNIPGGGGDWNRTSKRQTVDSVKGLIRSAFEGPVGTEDLARFGWSSLLETLLANALVEQQLFDCKQGFFSLGPNREFDAGSFKKILTTLTAMANMGPNVSGYVLVGVTDNAKDSDRVSEIDQVKAITHRGFRIVGIDRESHFAGSDINDYWHWIIQKIESSGLDRSLAANVAANAKLVHYRDRALVLLKVDGGQAPAFFEGKLFERRGSSTHELTQEEYIRVFQRFTAPR